MAGLRPWWCDLRHVSWMHATNYFVDQVSRDVSLCGQKDVICATVRRWRLWRPTRLDALMSLTSDTSCFKIMQRLQVSAEGPVITCSYK
jgi:hypothetical protein